MNPRIAELTGRISELDVDETVELRQCILDEADRIAAEPETPANGASLTALAEAADKLTPKIERLRIGELRTAEPEAVTAAGARGSRVGRLARGRRTQASPERSDTAAAGQTVLTAAGSLYGIPEGTPVTDRWQLAEAMADTLDRMSRSGPPLGKVLVASAATEYPEERRVIGELAHDERVLEAVVGARALTASGGICMPVNVDFSIGSWATPERPLRDGLAAFMATRGGLRFVKPLDISDWAAATTIWSEATDAEPGESTKPVVSMACGSEEHVFVDAVPTRMGFGNMQGRFAPEQVASNVELAMAAAARVAENNLLEKIAAACVADVTSATLLGATRDLLTVIDQSVAAYKQIHRLPPSAVLTAIFPDWVKAQIRADLAREIGHSQNGDWNSFAITDEQIEELLRVHGVQAIFHLDGQPEPGSKKWPSQVFAQQKKEEAIKGFPAKLVWYLFASGQMQFLDAGRLDLGVVRDSTLDAVNSYELMVEVFEQVAFRGFTNGALQLVTELCANGSSAGTISTAGKCA